MSGEVNDAQIFLTFFDYFKYITQEKKGWVNDDNRTDRTRDNR